jgi:2',3'-cyclic-nucleotide 2'-phosphodiesterase
MRILFLGDIVGEPGVNVALQAVPWLRKQEQLDAVVANAENACNGAGMSPAQFRKMRHFGIDAFTMGDHIYKKQELIKSMANGSPICKPANFPADAPGAEFVLIPVPDSPPLAVVSVLGRVYMRPVDCPFQAIDRVLMKIGEQTKCILVDVHAEATSDKGLLGRYLDGRVSAVVGTHTHVATADEQILPGGTAFITDVGMTGPHDSVLGRRYDRVLFTTRTFVPSAFEVAKDDARLSGVVMEIDPATGRGVSIRRIQVREEEVPKVNPE